MRMSHLAGTVDHANCPTAIIFANAGGPPEESYAGLSQICVPYVGPLVKLAGCAEGMAIANLDMQVLEVAEANYQVRADLAKEDWHYEYRHMNRAATL